MESLSDRMNPSSRLKDAERLNTIFSLFYSLLLPVFSCFVFSYDTTMSAPWVSYSPILVRWNYIPPWKAGQLAWFRLAIIRKAIRKGSLRERKRRLMIRIADRVSLRLARSLGDSKSEFGNGERDRAWTLRSFVALFSAVISLITKERRTRDFTNEEKHNCKERTS